MLHHTCTACLPTLSHQLVVRLERIACCALVWCHASICACLQQWALTGQPNVPNRVQYEHHVSGVPLNDTAQKKAAGQLHVFLKWPPTRTATKEDTHG
jgi:hypothetical protein